MVSRKALPAGVGTVPLCQLLPVNQSLDVFPVQMLCARAGERAATCTITATPDATTAGHRSPTCRYERFALSGTFDVLVSLPDLLRHRCLRECLAMKLRGPRFMTSLASQGSARARACEVIPGSDEVEATRPTGGRQFAVR